MAIYRVEEEDDMFNPMLLIFYVLLFSILLPIGIIYLIVKICSHVKKNKYEKARNSSEAISNTVDALNQLDIAKQKGLISEEEYEILSRKRRKELQKL